MSIDLATILERPPDDPVQVLDPEGEVVDSALLPALSDTELLDIYRDLRTTRHFDERMVSLQRQGRIGTFSPAAGQEASQVATTYALRDDDPVTFQYREHGAVVARGFPPEYIEYWAGYESGNAALWDGHIVPLNISIAGHIPHATGMAWAADLKDEDTVVACHFGDGATSEGDFHEGLNFAGVFDTPSVFICHNNGWAISVPRANQTRSATIAQKADAYGFTGIQVDGMDPLACYVAMEAAVQNARNKSDHGRPRPVLLETIEYRFGAHTTADDPTAYREESEVTEWRHKDPLIRFETYLRDRGLLDDDAVAAIKTDAQDQMAAAVDRLENAEVDIADIFVDAYAELPPRLRDQREYLQALRDHHGDETLSNKE
jgi:pyruvate dehydrogenase E1 component alpha subunit